MAVESLHQKLYITNTETKQKEAVPTTNGKVHYYTCGPTVYAFAHIGNFRTFVVEDLLRRSLRFFGYTVVQVMNLTDVDDKTIKGAIENKKTLDDYTRPFKEAFFEDLGYLNIEKVEHYPEATKYIPQMIEMIKQLIDKKIAYIGADGSVYYSISKCSHYGKLSHLKLEDLKSGASNRLASDEYTKESASDFVLWKSYDRERDGTIFWESPFGPGRPGWHIECSVMASKILGETIDLHAGGVDLIFPHHENEIAQSEACFEKQFCKMWLHVEHLLVDNKKMSKSLGNFYTLRDLLKQGFTGKEVRFMLLGTHYRTQLNYTKSSLAAARSALDRIQECIFRLKEVKTESASSQLTKYLQEMTDHFAAALADDLNISAALAHLFDMIRHINGLMDKCLVNCTDAKSVLSTLHQMNKVLGVMTFEEAVIPEDIQQMVEKRLQARKEKNFSLSDELRYAIMDKGYLVEDTPNGARIKKI